MKSPLSALRSPLSTRGGFTLIELLFVILIIGLLAAMTFKMVGVIGRNNDVAKTRTILEKVGNACEEFRAIYGKYPPVSRYDDEQPVAFEYPQCRTFIDNDDGGESVSWPDSVASQILSNEKSNGKFTWSISGDDKRGAPFYKFGLVSYFLPRVASQGGLTGAQQKLLGIGSNAMSGQSVAQWGDYNSRASGKIGDSRRDVDACRRILPHLDAKLNPDNTPVSINPDKYPAPHYGIIWLNGVVKRPVGSVVRAIAGIPAENGSSINSTYSIYDAWSQHIRYRSLPPYDAFTLWSIGPDGKDGTDDDIILGEF